MAEPIQAIRPGPPSAANDPVSLGGVRKFRALRHLPSDHAGQLQDRLPRLVAHGALPDRENSPSCRFEFTALPGIPFDVRVELRPPEFGAGLRRSGVPAARMAVPEATVDEDCHPKPGEHDVRAARKIRRMQPETEPEQMQSTAYKPLRPGMLLTNRGHHPRSGF